MCSVYSRKYLRNIFLVHLVRPGRIQNSADEFLHRGHARLLFCKINQTHHHNQEDKEHQGKRYEDAKN